MLLLGLMAATWRVPFLPTRAGLGSRRPAPHGQVPNRHLRPYPGRSATARSCWPCRRLHVDAALVHLNRADAAGNGQFLGADLYMDDWMAQAAAPHLPVGRAHRAHRRTWPRRARTTRCASAGSRCTAWSRHPTGAHFTECPPDYGRDEAFQKRVRRHRRLRRGVGGVPGHVPRSCPARPTTRSDRGGQGRWPTMSAASRADVCAVAIAECFRGDGESPRATRSARMPIIGGRLARATFEPDVGDHRRLRRLRGRGLPARTRKATVALESWNPYPQMFTCLWNGRRHVMMGATQVDATATRTSPASATGTNPRPSCSASGGHRATPSTTPPPTGCPTTAPRCSSSGSTWCAVWATTGRPSWARWLPASTRSAGSCPTSGCFDFETPDHRMRLRSVHPGVERGRGDRGHGLRVGGSRRRRGRRAGEPVAHRRRARVDSPHRS